jgi:alpha-D-xyloside xylohydrolase
LSDVARPLPSSSPNSPPATYAVRRAVLVVILCTLVPWGSPAEAGAGRGPIRLRTPAAAVRVGRRFRLLVTDRRHRRRVASQPREGALFYRRGGTEHRLRRVRAVRRTSDGAVLSVDTDEGLVAQVTLAWSTHRTLEVTFEPPAADDVTAIGARWQLHGSEAIYGLMERLRDSQGIAPGLGLDTPIEELDPPEAGSLDRRGQTVEMKVKPTSALYAPFYQSSRGYGLVVAGTMVGTYDVGASDTAVLRFEFETGTTAESRRLRFHVIVGPDHATILDEYTALTGRPFVPPAWALGHWIWRNELGTDPPRELDGVPVNATVAEDVAMYEQLGFPPPVYVLDRPVFQDDTDGFGYSRFAWDETVLPNPASMLASMRSRGYRVAVWQSTWQCGSGALDNGAQALALGFLAPGGGTPRCANLGGRHFILDVTNPAARAWYRDKLAAFAAAWDVDAFRLDRGSEFIPSAASDVWADGRSGREVRNAYPVLQDEIAHDALAQVRGRDFVLWIREGYAGSQRWGGVAEGGDTVGTELGLRAMIIGQENAAFLGFPIWGSDTGGVTKLPDRELFARWLEFSAFSGMMEIGGLPALRPWDWPTEPHSDQELVDVYRRATRLREALRDYLAAAAEQAGATGMPIVRPMPFYDRRDPRLRDLWDQYLFGPDLMVAPVWRIGERAREVYFPRGRWCSLWKPSECHRGRRRETVAAPLDTIPVFVRKGAAVPALPDDVRPPGQAGGAEGR